MLDTFALQNFKSAGPPKKSYPHSHGWIAARHLEKFRDVIPTGLKVITAKTLNLSQFLNIFVKKLLLDPRPQWGAG